MRCRWSNISEEGLVLWRRPPNEVGGLPREHVGEEVVFLAAVGDHLPVLVDPVVVQPLPVELAVPLVPARGDVGRIAGGVAV